MIYGPRYAFAIPPSYVRIAAGASIQAAVNANPAGTAFWLATGTYREQTIVPKVGNSFTGDLGAVLKGSKLLTGWNQSGSNFFVGGQTQGSGGSSGGQCQAGFPRCGFVEDVFYDGVALQAVDSLAALGPGKFFFDYGADRIYIRDNPSGHTVETSTTECAFDGFISNVTIRNLSIQQYGNPAQSGAVRLGAGSLIDRCEVNWNHGVGGWMADTITYQFTDLSHNGQMGIGGSSVNGTVRFCQISYNNWAGFQPGWEAGGSKFTSSTGTRIQDNWFHHNGGPGCWFDINNDQFLIERNRCEDNFSPDGIGTAPGIMIEISRGGIIRWNSCLRNGAGMSDYAWSAGILVAASGGTGLDIYENWVDDNEHGISLIQQNRDPDGPGLWVQNVDVHDNWIRCNRGYTGAFTDTGDNAIFDSRNNRFRNNHYITSGNFLGFGWKGPQTWAGWQGFGQDLAGSIASTPTAPQTFTVGVGGNLQTALNNALPGDTILLNPNSTYTANFTLPVKAGVTPITVTHLGSIPAEGTRVIPSTAALFPKLQASPGGSPALATVAGTRGYTFIGIEFKPNPGGFNNLIDLGDGSNAQNTSAAVPHYLILDRCYIHGDPGFGQKRGVGLNCGYAEITNCYISDIFASGQDSQAVGGWNGPGPYLIDNNYLEGASENFLLGGNDVYITDQLPSDVMFTANYVAKKPAWVGQGYNIKNLLELKIGRNIVIWGNTFEYNWAEAQPGYGIVFTVRNESGATPWATIANVTYAANILRHSSSGFNILYKDDRPGIVSVPMTGLVIQDSTLYDINPSAFGGGSGHLAQVQGGDRVTFNHVTAILTQAGQAVSFYLVGADLLTNFVFTNNILPQAPVPNLAIYGDQGTSAGTAALNAAVNGSYVAARNVIYGTGPLGGYPADTLYAATINDVGFTNVAGNDYRLQSSSPYHNAGLDGTDIGDRTGTVPAVTSQGFGVPALTLGVQGNGRRNAYAFGVPALTLGVVGAGVQPNKAGFGVPNLTLGAVGDGKQFPFGSGSADLSLGAIGSSATAHFGYGSVDLVLGAQGVGRFAPQGFASVDLALGLIGASTAIHFGYGAPALVLGATGAGQKVDSGFGEAALVLGAVGSSANTFFGFGSCDLVLGAEGAGSGTQQGFGAPNLTLGAAGDGFAPNIAAGGSGEMPLTLLLSGFGTMPAQGPAAGFSELHLTLGALGVGFSSTILTPGCRAFRALQAIVAAINLGEGDEAGYLLWEWPDGPEWVDHTCVGPDGRRYWANIVAYPDGSFYWILGGLGGYGLQPYWVFGGFANPALYVAP